MIVFFVHPVSLLDKTSPELDTYICYQRLISWISSKLFLISPSPQGAMTWQTFLISGYTEQESNLYDFFLLAHIPIDAWGV